MLVGYNIGYQKVCQRVLITETIVHHPCVQWSLKPRNEYYSKKEPVKWLRNCSEINATNCSSKVTYYSIIIYKYVHCGSSRKNYLRVVKHVNDWSHFQVRKRRVIGTYELTPWMAQDNTVPFNLLLSATKCCLTRLIYITTAALQCQVLYCTSQRLFGC